MANNKVKNKTSVGLAHRRAIMLVILAFLPCLKAEDDSVPLTDVLFSDQG